MKDKRAPSVPPRTGGYGFHGPFEHISVEGMETAVNIIKSIVKHVLMLADA